MDTTALLAYMIAGTAAFIVGVVFLLLEFRRPGLSRGALISYLCFMASVILLSNQWLFTLLACAGLSALFALLYFFYKKSVTKETR